MTASPPDTAAGGFYPAVLGRRERLIAGIVGIGLGVIVPLGVSVALLASTGDLAFVIFPLPFLGALWMIQGLAPAGYTVDEEGVRIERRWAPRLLPYAQIRRVDRVRRPIGGLFALGVNALFGSHGMRWNPRTGLHYIAVTNRHDLVYLHTARGLLVLSPSRPDEFVAELTRRLQSVERGG